MKEFNLSEKIDNFGNCIYIIDVKEFISLLKEETQEWLSIEEFDGWCRKINKLLGEKLVKVEEKKS